MSRLSPLFLIAYLACLAPAACTVADEPAESDTSGDGAPPAADSTPDDATAGTTEAADDPFAAFDIPSGGEATAERRRVSLLLRNPTEALALVYADGGAGEVFLDSVPGGEDRRVNLQTRAGVVTLRSEGPDGAPLRRTEVTPGLPTVHEVIVADTPRAP